MTQDMPVQEGAQRCRKRSFFVITGTIFFCALMFWLSGYGCFLKSVQNQKPLDPRQPTDAIVVLTGGSFRVNKALDLLAAGQAEKLFISGVNNHVSLNEILELWKRPIIDSDIKDCCIILGHKARNTIQNAQETRQWIKDQEVKSIRLVTSDYHMPRALLEFQKKIPEANILPWPVKSYPAALNRIDFLILTFGEYNKTLITYFRTHIFFSWAFTSSIKAEQ
ncbi:MAG: YdcF family protein [Micavibrio sp.]